MATILLDGFSQQGVYIRLDNIPSTSTITFSNMKLQLGLNVVVSNLSQAVDGMRLDMVDCKINPNAVRTKRSASFKMVFTTNPSFRS
ncbi:hypothetical protein [Latilactobacillus curvatus]|uniref:hypothetical protein n=1 Tax=Latilactobacillus curvatus TaxID=28038 RepID=UPI001F263198|nr:hypothetical protein [Latilactobacillus curvatus]